MLPPNYLINRIEPITLMYNDLHTSILEAIARYIADTLRATGAPGVIPSAVYKIERAQVVGLLYDDIVKEVAQINKMSRADIRQLFEDAAVKTLTYDNRIYEAAGLTPIPIQQSPEMLQILNAGISKTLGSIQRLTGTIATNAQERFEELLNLGYNKVASGAFSYQEAIASTVDDLAREGVTMFEYASGHRISVEAAVRMNLLTGANQTAAEITKQSMIDMRVSLVRTSAHVGSRTHPDGGFKDHTTWQGKVFKWKEIDKGTGL